KKIKQAESHNEHDRDGHRPAPVIVTKLGMAVRTIKHAAANLLHGNVRSARRALGETLEPHSHLTSSKRRARPSQLICPKIRPGPGDCLKPFAPRVARIEVVPEFDA